MDTTLLIFACLALGAAAVLFAVIAIVAVNAGKNLNRVTAVVELMQKDVHELRVSSTPVFEKAGRVLDQTERSIVKLESDLSKLSNGAQSLAGIAEDIRMLEQSLLARVRPSLEDLASLVSGVAKGVTTFARKLTDR
ncbi:MAG: hypothetical protein NTX15_03910 [Candidatus Kapabacteria bacterium]|nr:hypothetical protein [Candidatus Kapabacteria bacterium]